MSRNKLSFLTSDERVAEVIEETSKLLSNKTSNQMPLDLVVTPLASGNKDYIEWVKTQTLKKDPDAAFFEKPSLVSAKREPESQMSAVQTKQEVKVDEGEEEGEESEEDDEEEDKKE